MKISTKLKEVITQEMVKGLITYAFAAATVPTILTAFIPLDLIRKVDPLIWFRLTIIALAVCLVLIVYIFRQRPKYVFFHDLGIYQEKKTGNYFCPSCMSNDKKSHLKEYDTAWVCLTKDCKRTYYKPGNEPKSQGRRIISPGINDGWVRGWKK